MCAVRYVLKNIIHSRKTFSFMNVKPNVKTNFNENLPRVNNFQISLLYAYMKTSKIK